MAVFDITFYPLDTLSSVGRAATAASYVIRNWARDEHAWVGVTSRMPEGKLEAESCDNAAQWDCIMLSM